jgi:predicted alpha/beta-hydrolase family hydrolase
MRGWIALAASLMLTTACGSGREAPSNGTRPSPTTTPASTSRFPDIVESEALAMSEPVRFPAADGVPLEGRIFGSGEVGVVLSHMRPGDQSQWLPFAALLATEGYRVLTYNRRGNCPGGELGCSGGTETGDDWKDLKPAVDLVRRAGSRRVVVGGASLGAMESLFALSRGLEADGLIWVSGYDFYGLVPVQRQVRGVRVPKLFVAGESDRGAATLLSVFDRVAPSPKEIVVLPTGEHGTEILAYADPSVADELRQTVLDFLGTI